MDNKFEDEELIEEIEEQDNQIDYPNLKDDNLQINYNQIRHNYDRKNTTNKLREKIENNKTKNLFNRNYRTNNTEESNDSPSNDPENSPQEEQQKNVGQSLNDKIKQFGQNVGNGAKEARKVAGEAAKKAVAAGVKALVTNPYFWVIAGVLLLIIIIPILWAAYDGDSGGSSNGIGYYDQNCDYNLTRVDLTLDDGSYSAQNLNMEDYILGVVYGEIGEYIYLDGYEEYAKMMMIAAKTYVLRYGEYNNETKKVKMKASTYQQGWCDVKNGCMYYATCSTCFWYYSKASSISKSGATTYKEALNEANLAKAKETYKSIENYILVKKDVDDIITSFDQIAESGYIDHTQNYWNKLAKEGKTFREMIELTATDSYTDYQNTSTDQTIRDSYKEVKLYKLGDYCTFISTSGNNCTTSPPILIGENEKYTITSRFGPRPAPCPRCSTYHNGIDLGYPFNTPIYAIYDGVIAVSCNNCQSTGNWIKIDHDLDGDGVYDYASGYMHMNQPPKYKVGDKVVAGEQIGVVGSTGDSTGPHLHFEIYDYNKKGYIDSEPILNGLKDKNSIFDTSGVCSDSNNIGDDIYYYQCDEKWGSYKICDAGDYVNGRCVSSNTICSSGCGYTSFAMIAAKLNNDSSITPLNVVPFLGKYSPNPSGGALTNAALTNQAVLDEYKLKGEVIVPYHGGHTVAQKKQILKDAINKGQVVELLIPGHYVVLVKGDNGKIRLLDPNYPDKNGDYDIDSLHKKFASYKTCENNDCLLFAVGFTKK